MQIVAYKCDKCTKIIEERKQVTLLGPPLDVCMDCYAKLKTHLVCLDLPFEEDGRTIRLLAKETI